MKDKWDWRMGLYMHYCPCKQVLSSTTSIPTKQVFIWICSLNALNGWTAESKLLSSHFPPHTHTKPFLLSSVPSLAHKNVRHILAYTRLNRNVSFVINLRAQVENGLQLHWIGIQQIMGLVKQQILLGTNLNLLTVDTWGSSLPVYLLLCWSNNELESNIQMAKWIANQARLTFITSHDLKGIY